MQSAANFHAVVGHLLNNIVVTLSAHTIDDKRRGVWWRLFLALALMLPFGGCTTSLAVKDTTRTFDTVVIDAGHGGFDDGAKSRWGGREKNNSLSVAQKLQPKLRAAGFKTVMTRSSDLFVELNDRAAISNRQNNCVFVSIHFNDSRSRRIRGTEVYYKAPVAQPIARRIISKIDSIPGFSARFVKTADFRVLRLNRYPAVLVECGYLSNRNEGSLCCSPKQHERLADAIASALIEQRGRVAPVVASTSPTTSPAVH